MPPPPCPLTPRGCPHPCVPSPPVSHLDTLIRSGDANRMGEKSLVPPAKALSPHSVPSSTTTSQSLPLRWLPICANANRPLLPSNTTNIWVQRAFLRHNFPVSKAEPVYDIRAISPEQTEVIATGSFECLRPSAAAAET